MKRIITFVLLIMILLGCSTRENASETVYQVVLWDETADYTSAPLYLATTKAPNAITEKRDALPGTFSEPIAIFATADAPKDTKENARNTFLLLDLYEQQVINVYTLHRKLEGHSKSKSLIDPLVSLAEKTSEASPMYLVHDGKFLYAVIEDTAYFISSWGQASAPKTIAGIALDQTTAKTIKIDLNSKNHSEVEAIHSHHNIASTDKTNANEIVTYYCAIAHPQIQALLAGYRDMECNFQSCKLHCLLYSS